MNRLLYASVCTAALLAGTPAEAHEQCSTRFGVTTCKLHASVFALGEQIIREFSAARGALPTFTLVVERIISDTCGIAGDPACEQCLWSLDIAGQESRLIGGLSLGEARLDGQGVVQINPNNEMIVLDETIVDFRVPTECFIGMAVRYTTDFHKLYP